jgi:hypothetical protein
MERRNRRLGSGHDGEWKITGRRKAARQRQAGSRRVLRLRSSRRPAGETDNELRIVVERLH